MQTRKLIALAILPLALASFACTAEVEEKGEMPEVNVEGGKAPEIDVDPAEVNISTDTQQVVTPEVNVTPTEGNDP